MRNDCPDAVKTPPMIFVDENTDNQMEIISTVNQIQPETKSHAKSDDFVLSVRNSA